MPNRQATKGIRSQLVIASLATGILAFLGGMALNAYSIASNLATKPYVDDGLASQRKYTDEKAELIRKDAYEHSDMNRQQTINEMKEYGSEIKSQGVKLDMVLDSVRQLQFNGSDREMPVRRNSK